MESKFDNIEEQRQWEYENLSIEELEERGWAVLDDRPKKFDLGCFCRHCVHFHGKEKGTCGAYPGGIPDRFSTGLEAHVVIEKDQREDITYLFNSDFRY